MARALLLLAFLASPAVAQDRPKAVEDPTAPAAGSPTADTASDALDAMRRAVRAIGGQLDDGFEAPDLLRLRVLSEPRNWA